MFPSFLLAKLYVKGSLKNTDDGFTFNLKNIIDSTRLAGVGPITVADKTYEAAAITLVADGKETNGADMSRANTVNARMGAALTINVKGEQLPAGPNKVNLTALTTDIGKIKFDFTDEI